MKKKKGFTLVELLVVIAILAVLATVSVVGYMGFTKKAHESNDIGLTTQMNTILQAEEVTNKPTTPHEAVKQLANGGVDVEKLTPTTDGYNYVYDLDANRMFLLDDSKVVVAPTNITFTKDLNVFAFVGSENEITNWNGYSIYLKTNFKISSENLFANLKTGLDVGNNTIESITYTGSSSKEALIRTNGGKLVINASNDVVHHYGASDYINVVAIKNDSYHEFGSAVYTRVESGHYVAEKTATVLNLNVTSSSVTITEENGANVVSYSKSNNDVIVTVNGTTKETDNIKTEAEINEAVKNSDVVTEGGVAEVNGIQYLTLDSAIKTTLNGTIKILKDTSVGYVIIYENQNITINVNGHNVKTVGEDRGHWSKIYGSLTMTGDGFFGDDSMSSVGYLFDLYENSKLKIENCDLYIKCGLSCIQMSDNSEAKIYGGYWIGGTYQNKYWTINKIDAHKDTAKVIVYGGKFENFDPSNSKTEDPVQNWVADGYKVIQTEIGSDNNKSTLYTVISK